MWSRDANNLGTRTEAVYTERMTAACALTASGKNPRRNLRVSIWLFRGSSRRPHNCARRDASRSCCAGDTHRYPVGIGIQAPSSRRCARMEPWTFARRIGCWRWILVKAATWSETHAICSHASGTRIVIKTIARSINAPTPS
jgi:hypothetical protein